MTKTRLDVLLCEKGFAESREKAKAIIISGAVLVNDKPETKPGDTFDESVNIRIKGEVCPFVSRGGLKLQKAMQVFGLELSGKVCADIGASTGGFTDCMLQHGAEKVYAVDVGYGQLDWRLRNDERVVVMERTNARFLTAEDICDIDFASVDVSFISLKLILPALMNITKQNAEIVTLIKPQFEAGKENVGKKGVVKDAKVHEQVIKGVFKAAVEIGWYPKMLDYSPIKGPNGNIEYIACYSKNACELPLEEEICKIIENSHKNL